MKIIASFDDGVKEDLILSEMMKKYDIPTIFYFPCVPNQVNEPHGRSSLNSQERQVIAKDHEIGSHTLHHPLLTRIPPETARSEIELSKKFLEREFGRPITAFCYPRGYSNPELQNMVMQAGYTHARGVTVGYLHKSENPYYEQTTVHVGCDRKEYAGLNWYEYALVMLEQADNDSVYHLWGHGWEIAQYPDGFKLLDKLCKKLKEKK